MRYWVLLTIIFFTGHAYGQIPNIPIETYKYDTTHIINYGNLMAIRLVSPRRTYSFRLKNRLTKDILAYRPNLQSAFGIGFTYRWLAFDIIFNPKWNRQKTDKFGETKEFNIRSTLYLKRDMLDIIFRTYKGLFISNPEDYLNPWDGTYPYRPDIRSTNFIITYSIPSNYKEYSPKTTFQLDGRMKKSAGSVMYLSTLHMSLLKADSSLLPIEYENALNPQAQITRISSVLFKQSVGYAYTFIHKNFYFTLSAFPGLALTLGTVEYSGGKYNPNILNFSFDSRNGFGYNSRRWYAGVFYIYNYQNMKLTEELAFNTNLGELRFFIGYRIQAPYLINSVIRK
jgi:Domain of unknown function (DUF4421)